MPSVEARCSRKQRTRVDDGQGLAPQVDDSALLASQKWNRVEGQRLRHLGYGLEGYGEVPRRDLEAEKLAHDFVLKRRATWSRRAAVSESRAA